MVNLLTTMNKRVETGRQRETQEKRKADSSTAPAVTSKPAADVHQHHEGEHRVDTRDQACRKPAKPDIQVDQGVPSTIVQKNAADRHQQVEAMQQKLATRNRSCYDYPVAG